MNNNFIIIIASINLHISEVSNHFLAGFHTGFFVSGEGGNMSQFYDKTLPGGRGNMLLGGFPTPLYETLVSTKVYQLGTACGDYSFRIGCTTLFSEKLPVDYVLYFSTHHSDPDLL